MRLFTGYLFILNIALCYGQVIEKNICVGNAEIAFSRGSRNFDGARTFCQVIFRGHMVKIGSAEIQDAIKNSIVVKPIYYIGANDADGNNEYHWVADNSAVPKNPRLIWPESSSGYQNWKANQPNNKDGEKCVVLGEHSVYEWSDFDCNREARFICQRRSWRILTITKPNNIVTCESSIPDVSVKWQKNSIDVKSSDRSGVYQENRSNTATLHPENANITESGTYTCVSAVSSCSARRSYNVTVDGTPTIQSIVGNKCNASLFVTWKPNKAAVGFIHRFTAIGTKISVDVTPTGKDFFMTEIGGLAISRAYNVQVKVCETNDACTTSYTANDKATTDGVTSPVTQATITRNGTCQAKWKGSDSTETYTIETKCTVDKSREVGEGKTSNETTKNWKTTTFTFQAASNRKCSATIWAKGCGKISTPVSATGSCTTPPKEPPALTLPTVEGNGTSKTIKISKPNEDNGLISCIFIVLCYDDCSNTQFSLQDLQKASQTDATNNTEKANTIAVAINMSNSLTNPISRKLSQREVTTCDLYNTGLTAATSVKRIKGNNYIHNSTKNVWAYAVTSTPSENNILFQSSGPILVLEDDSGPEPQGSFQTWIIGLIIGILVVVILVILVIIFIRRRNQHADSPKPQNGNEAAVPHTETRFDGSVRAPRQFENPINREGEAGGGYMNFVVPVDDGTSINVRDLESRYNNMKNSGAFKVQYDEIVQKANKLGKTTDVAKHETVIKKNRYKNILPFDDSRVSLAGSESGYINASFVNGFRQPNRYIATQGPLKSTVADFWLMTMEQNSQIIVMLTREYDAGKKKCEKYWPDFGKAFNFSNGISVESRQETSCNSYIERMLVVQHKATGKTLTTYQYQFMKWPDHGVPQTTSNLMRMQRVVTKKLNELGSQAPIIVHCSAGAGRTGAFIAYDILLKQSQATGKVDVYECVMEMRKRRIQMVQNCDQYTLVYKLLVEENIFDDYDASADQAKMKLQEILTSNAGAQQLEKEFGQLDRIEPMKNQKLVGIEKRNRPYNRGRLAIPYDYSLAGVTMKMGETSVPYINASFVEAYDNSTKMIAAQGPFENTVEIFWRAVMDNNVTTIVMLCDLTEGREEQSAQYWPPTVGGTSSWGNITVVKISEEAIENITERKMELKRGTEVKYVTQFHFTEWKENSSPDDTREILELVNKMQKHSRSAGEGAAVLVHCNDGIGRTGAFCTIVNLIDRMKWENRIDVFRTVKDLRDGRPYMVKSLDQYQFCYQAIVGYLKSFELYANF